MTETYDSINKIGSHGFRPPTLVEIDKQLDRIIRYIGYGRQVPIPASGDWADYYYDEWLPSYKKRKKQKQSPNIVQEPTDEKLKSQIGIKIDCISKYIGVYDLPLKYLPHPAGGDVFGWTYKYKRGMGKKVFEDVI